MCQAVPIVRASALYQQVYSWIRKGIERTDRRSRDICQRTEVATSSALADQVSGKIRPPEMSKAIESQRLGLQLLQSQRHAKKIDILLQEQRPFQ